jgi:Domain of unknown function (DUF4430)
VRRRWSHTGSVVVLALASAALAAGCGLGAGTAPHAVQLLVTRDFGARVLGASNHPRTAGQETVMRLLERNHHVATRYGGGFVESIEGLSGGHEEGQPVDWFYYVNGIEAEMGAAATNVHAGDRIWWDLHDWSQTDDVPAVVGSFPEPFLNGSGGKRLPVRVECASESQSACATVTGRLQRLGVPAAVSALGPGEGEATLRVLVGPWSAIDHDTVAAQIERGPRHSGVYATFAGGGQRLSLLDESGRDARSLSGDAGLVAATREGKQAPVWVITGTDAAGVTLAANGLNEAALRDRFAVAFLPGQSIALPEAGQ